MNQRSIFIAAALLAGWAGGASGQTVVRLTGSSHFRASVHQAILAILADRAYGYTGPSLETADQVLFEGTYQGKPYLIKTSWTGSAAGIHHVASEAPALFLPDSTLRNGTGVPFAPVGMEAGQSQIAISEVSQNVTFSNPASQPDRVKLVDRVVAVCPFVWVANDGAPANLTNITPDTASQLLLHGELPLALFTGDPADQATKVYAAGEGRDSGARILASLESFIGPFARHVNHQPALAGDEMISQRYWPEDETELGDGGYRSGTALAGILTRKSFSALRGHYVSYLSVYDFETVAQPGGAKALRWSGVPCSGLTIREGLYTMWSYERVMHRADLSGRPLAFANALTARLAGDPGPVGIPLDAMAVSRPGDGMLPESAD